MTHMRQYCSFVLNCKPVTNAFFVALYKHTQLLELTPELKLWTKCTATNVFFYRPPLYHIIIRADRTRIRRQSPMLVHEKRMSQQCYLFLFCFSNQWITYKVPNIRF